MNGVVKGQRKSRVEWKRKHPRGRLKHSKGTERAKDSRARQFFIFYIIFRISYRASVAVVFVLFLTAVQKPFLVPLRRFSGNFETLQTSLKHFPIFCDERGKLNFPAF